MIEQHPFGTLRNGTPVTEFVLTNLHGMQVSVLDYGCTLRRVVLPHKDGALDVCLGYDTIAEYEAHDGYLGAVIGRFANRIRGASFDLNGKTYPLAANDGKNHLHGGVRGFDKYVHAARTQHNSVLFARTSPDGEEGYPAALSYLVTVTLSDDDTLSLRYEAMADGDTLFHPTNHVYWNLNGHGAGDVLGHTLKLPALWMLPIDDETLPTGNLIETLGTPFDFRRTASIGSRIDDDNAQLRFGHGYDHCLFLKPDNAIVLTGERSGVCLHVTTDRPAVQLYTANALTPRTGKDGVRYAPRHGVCLETQAAPDAPHHADFPTALLKKGALFSSETAYRFTYEGSKPCTSKI